MSNAAFVFVKPHANTDATRALVKETLAAKGITIVSEGTITSEDIDSKKYIDQHYYAIASKATILKPSELVIPSDKFEAAFGLTWDAAMAAGNVYNALDACAVLGLDASALDAEWAKAKKAGKVVKFGGGFYCGLVEVEGKTPIYCFNAFFMSMRSKFTAPGLSIYYYSVQWDPKTLPWSAFRGAVLGPTDPAEAPADSIRGMILAKWEALGLKEVPNTGDNGVHASASPFEGLAERANWLGADLAADPFGASLVEAGVPLETIKAWSVDPRVKLDAAGAEGSIFDALEDQDAPDCLAKCAELAKL